MRGSAVLPVALALAGAAGPGMAALLQPPEQQPQAFEAASTQAQPDNRFGTLPDQEIEGVRTKSEPISRYSGAPLARQASPVGLLQVTVRLEGNLARTETFPCTAWLVRPDLVMTAYHCMPGVPRALQREGSWRTDRAIVTFNHDGEQVGDVYSIAGVAEQNPQLDYALLRLQRNAPDHQGVIRLLPELPPAGAPLFMFHHPYGAPLMVLKDGTCRMVAGRPDGTGFSHHCDTRGGSSGAPVLVYDTGETEAGLAATLAVGLHTTGLREGLNDPSDINQATSVAAIVGASPFLADIACEVDLSGISCPPLYPPAGIGTAAAPTIVYFDWGQDTLTDRARQTLINLAQGLRQCEYDGVVVGGHVDRVGSSSYSVGLSQRMANNVRDFLVGQGVDAGRIATQAFGESRPAVATADGVREPDNRRVEISVSGTCG